MQTSLKKQPPPNDMNPSISDGYRQVLPSPALTFTGLLPVARYPKALAKIDKNYETGKNLLENNCSVLTYLT